MDGRKGANSGVALTAGIRIHAHQRGQLRRATAMGDMQTAAGRARHTSRLGLGLL